MNENMADYGFFIATTKEHELLVCKELTHEPNDNQLSEVIKAFEANTNGDFIGYLLYRNVIYQCSINANDGGLDKIIPERFDTGILYILEQLLNKRIKGFKLTFEEVSNIFVETLQTIFEIYNVSANYDYNNIENIEFEIYFNSYLGYLDTELMNMFGDHILDVTKFQTDAGDYGYNFSVYLDQNLTY